MTLANGTPAKLADKIRGIPSSPINHVITFVATVLSLLTSLYTLGTLLLSWFQNVPTQVSSSQVTIIVGSILFVLIVWYRLKRSQKPATSRRLALTRLLGWLSVVLITLSIITLSIVQVRTFLLYRTITEPVRDGLFGIAVADFVGTENQVPSQAGKELADSVAKTLQLIIQGDGRLKPIAKAIRVGAVRNEGEAAKVAKRSNAALIVWGQISSNNEKSLQPEFLLVKPLPHRVAWRGLPDDYIAEIRASELELRDVTTHRISGLVDLLLSFVLLSQKDYSGAEDRLRHAIEVTQFELNELPLGAPSRVSVHRLLAVYHLALGRIYAVQNRSLEAEKEYENAKRYDESYGPIYISFGNLYYEHRKCEDALRQYEEALALEPARAAAYYSRGTAYDCLGNYDAAIADYEQAIKKAQSDNERALYSFVLASTYCELGQHEQGRNELQRAPDLRAAEPDIERIRDAAEALCQPPITPTSTTLPAPTPELSATPAVDATPEPTQPTPPRTPSPIPVASPFRPPTLEPLITPPDGAASVPGVEPPVPFSLSSPTNE